MYREKLIESTLASLLLRVGSWYTLVSRRLFTPSFRLYFHLPA